MLHVPLFILSLALALALGEGGPAFGQSAGGTGDAPGASQEAGGEVNLVEVVIDGETLFSVRGVTAYPAERRAREIEGRIRAVAANQDIPAGSLTLDEKPGVTWIMAAGQRVMGVLDSDAVIEQIDRRRLAELYRTRIAEAIEAYRRARRPALLWSHALYALCATFALLGIAYIGRRVVARLRARIERRHQARIQGLQDRAFRLVKAEQIWRALTGVLNFAWAAVILVIIYVYLNYILALFPWTRGLG
jgi:hypothetical protein